MNDQTLNKTTPVTERINKQLASLFKHAPTAIALLEGPDHIYSYANLKYQVLYGRTEEKLIGRSFKEVFPELQEQGLYELFDQVYSTGEPFTASEFPARFEDKGVLKIGYYNFTIRPITDDSGGISGVMVHAHEVTQQVEAYKRAAESEAKYRSLFENTDHGCCVVEVIFDEHHHPLDYKFVEVNKVFESQTGLKNPQGKTARQLLPNLEDRWIQIYGKIALTGESARFVESSEAMGRWFDVNAFAIGRKGDKKVAIIFNDITSRKRVEQDIQETKNLLQAVYDSAPNSIAVMQTIYDENGGVDDFRIRMLNQYTVDIIGNVEFVGKRYSEVFPTVRPTGILDKFKEVALTGVSAKFERWYEGEGMKHWFRFTAVKQGELLVVMTEDITKEKLADKELKESEQRFAAAVEAVEGIVWTNSPEGKMEGLQPGWANLTGQSYDEYQGFGWAKAVHPDDADATLQAWNQAVRLQKTFEFEHRVWTANNEWRTFVVKAIPLKDADGLVRQWVGVHTDVTDRIKAAKELQESEKRFRNLSEKLEEEIELRTQQLRQSNDDLQQFAHVASHDLKEPVRKIKTFTSRLQEEFAESLNERGTLYIDKVQKATDRMVSMIDGVLTYSSVNATQMVAEVVNLNDIVENIKSDLEVVIQQKGAQIISDDLPIVEGARVLIDQLFYNLINNSIKFGRDDEPLTIEIKSEVISDNGKQYARILVTDNGIGFEQEFAESIFNAFSRLNPKDKYEGTGLGLSLCRKIVERHGGTIQASGIKGEGATFTIVLPLKQSIEG